VLAAYDELLNKHFQTVHVWYFRFVMIFSYLLWVIAVVYWTLLLMIPLYEQVHNILLQTPAGYTEACRY
jgi:hypothetical protein